MSRNKSRNDSRMNRLSPLVGLLAVGLSFAALAGAQSVEFPKYTVGPQPNGSWVVSDGAVITPAGTQVDLGIRVRAKAVALNPNLSTHTAAVLTMGTSTSDGNGAVEVFDTNTGIVVQNYITFGLDPSGTYSGITYSADGKYLVFSQDSSNVTITTVDKATGLLSDDAQVYVAPTNSFITCYPNAPGTVPWMPCGDLYSGYTSYPGGVAISKDDTTAYALLNQNDTLAQIDLSTTPPTFVQQIRVGNAPHSILLNGKGTTGYVSNEGGRAATDADFQIYSAGTEIVADPLLAHAVTGTVSVVDLASMTVTDTISTGGLHPTGLAFYGNELLVANAYSDTISVINTTNNTVTRTINLGLPIGIPGSGAAAYGAAPVSIAVDVTNGIAYVALYNANAVAVVNLSPSATTPVEGYIPVAYAPSSVVLDKPANVLLVANDKGIGTRDSFECDWGVCDYNTHQDNGTVSIVPIPDSATLATMTTQVTQNNHWDLAENISSASGGNPNAKPLVIPAKIGSPSLIKHVFVIVRENRTYDQILGDVAAGNGDPSLAVFGDGSAAGGTPITPNAHALVQRFPLLDNFYDPSRQSADGHNWILQAMAPYADDIQSPDWVRSYPSDGGDALAYQTKGWLFSEASAAGLPVKNYGEYVEDDAFLTPTGSTAEPYWSQFYADSQCFEGESGCAAPGTPGETTLYYQNTITPEDDIPALNNITVKNFPEFDTNIPDQFRVDLWVQDFNNDVANGTVPALEMLWIMCDHTGEYGLSGQQEQADNDLAVGRIIDYISHSAVWSTSAIFIEEDDAQNGVDHVDGHRSPGYIVSPYAVQNGPADHTYYSQVNMTRTIEQILGLPPMNQYDLVASPMRTDFTNNPPPENFAPWTHVLNALPLCTSGEPIGGSSAPPCSLPAPAVAKAKAKESAKVAALRAAWMQKRTEIFAGKQTKPDSEDPDTVNHLNWYEATGFVRPYPGESKVRPPSDFNRPAPTTVDDDDGL